MWLIFVSSVVKSSISTCMYMYVNIKTTWAILIISTDKEVSCIKKLNVLCPCTRSFRVLELAIIDFITWDQLHILCLITFEIALSKSKAGFNIHTSIALKSLGTLHGGFHYLRVFCCVYNLFYNAAKYSWVTEEIAIILLLLKKIVKK